MLKINARIACDIHATLDRIFQALHRRAKKVTVCVKKDMIFFVYLPLADIAQWWFLCQRSGQGLDQGLFLRFNYTLT